jgi:tryptophan synthase alpha chain
MSDVDRLFVRLKAEGRKGFLPFITAGDPDLAFTARLLKRLEELGCSMAELGIPYKRALGKQLKWRSVVEMLEATKPHRSMPVVTMVSYAIMYRHGLERFVDEAQKAGVAGAIVPDLLVEESGPLAKICRNRDFSLIQLVTPTTPEDRALRIAESSSGFLYFVSVTGITGERTELPEGLADRVQWLRGKTPLPICIGFGISRPEHVRLLAPVADGLIVGSAMVRLLAQHDTEGPDRVLERVDGLVKELMEPLSKAGV